MNPTGSIIILISCSFQEESDYRENAALEPLPALESLESLVKESMEKLHEDTYNGWVTDPSPTSTGQA